MRMFKVLAVGVFFVVVLAPLSSGAAIVKANGSKCIVNGYVPSTTGDHVSQLSNNSIMFGTKLFIETDCGGYQISFDEGEPISISENQFLVTNVSENTRTITIEGDGFNMSYVNLQFWPSNMYASMMDEYQYKLTEQSGGFWSDGDIRAHEFWVAIVTVICSLVVSLFVVDRFSKFQIERQVGLEITEGR